MANMNLKSALLNHHYDGVGTSLDASNLFLPNIDDTASIDPTGLVLPPTFARSASQNYGQTRGMSPEIGAPIPPWVVNNCFNNVVINSTTTFGYWLGSHPVLPTVSGSYAHSAVTPAPQSIESIYASLKAAHAPTIAEAPFIKPPISPEGTTLQYVGCIAVGGIVLVSIFNGGLEGYGMAALEMAAGANNIQACATNYLGYLANNPSADPNTSQTNLALGYELSGDNLGAITSYIDPDKPVSNPPPGWTPPTISEGLNSTNGVWDYGPDPSGYYGDSNTFDLICPFNPYPDVKTGSRNHNSLGGLHHDAAAQTTWTVPFGFSFQHQ